MIPPKKDGRWAFEYITYDICLKCYKYHFFWHWKELDSNEEIVLVSNCSAEKYIEKSKKKS